MRVFQTAAKKFEYERFRRIKFALDPAAVLQGVTLTAELVQLL